MTRTLLRFAGAFLAWLIPLAVLYPFVVPHYEKVVAPPVNAILAGFPERVEIEPLASGALTAWVHHPVRGRIPFLRDEYEPYTILVSLVLFPALILASPLPWPRRWRCLGWGLVWVWSGHVLMLALAMRARVCLDLRGGAFCSWKWGVALTSGQVIAVAVWLAMTWRVWIARLSGATDQAGRRR